MTSCSSVHAIDHVLVLFTIWILYSTYVICCTNHWLDPTSCLSFGAKKWSDPESYRSFWHKPMVGSGILSKFVHMFFTKIYNYPHFFTHLKLSLVRCAVWETHIFCQVGMKQMCIDAQSFRTYHNLHTKAGALLHTFETFPLRILVTLYW